MACSKVGVCCDGREDIDDRGEASSMWDRPRAPPGKPRQAELEEEGDGQICNCPKWLADHVSLIKLLNQSVGTRTFYPRIYLSASHEVFGITLIFTWLMTYIFFPHQIEDHPAKRIIGSYNPCFGWDYAPASWIALAFCSMNVLLTWRYSWLEQTRSFLLSPGGLTRVQWFGKITANMLALASNLWLLLWLIGPIGQSPGGSTNVSVWFLHTGIFVTYALSSYLCALANYLEALYDEDHSNVQLSNTIFIAIYSFSLGFLVVVYFVNLVEYEVGQEPALPPWLTQSADIVWIASVSSITSFLPKEPALRVTTELVFDPEVVGLVAE